MFVTAKFLVFVSMQISRIKAKANRCNRICHYLCAPKEKVFLFGTSQSGVLLELYVMSGFFYPYKKKKKKAQGHHHIMRRFHLYQGRQRLDTHKETCHTMRALHWM